MRASFAVRGVAALLLSGVAVVGFGETTSTVISGRVLTPDSRPLADVQVGFSLLTGPGAGNAATTPFGRAAQPMQQMGTRKTGPDGSFEIKPVRPNTVAALSVFSQEDGAAYGQFFKQVEVSDQPLEIRLPQSGEKVQGRVLNLADGQPVEGAAVSLLPILTVTVPGSDQQSGLLGRQMRLTTDAAGHFETDKFPSGARVSIEVAKNDPPLVMVPADDKPFHIYDLAAGGATTLPDVKVYPGHTIAGVVTDSDGKPVAGAKVVPMGGAVRAGSLNAEPAVTDADGRYRIEHQVPRKSGENYKFSFLTVKAEGYSPSSKNVEILRVDPAHLEVTQDFMLVK